MSNPWMLSTSILAAIMLLLGGRITWIGNEMEKHADLMHQINEEANKDLEEAIARNESSDSGE